MMYITFRSLAEDFPVKRSFSAGQRIDRADFPALQIPVPLAEAEIFDDFLYFTNHI